MARRTNRFDEVQRYVAGIDLAGHADHYVCGPRKDDGTHDIEHFGTTTNEILRMVAWLKERKVVSVAMESTSVYWIYVYDMLEKAGIGCLLVDTRTVKMVPGRKSDVRDAEWIATCLMKNLISSSFVPDEKIQRLRQYDRRIFDLSASISRSLVKLDACMQRCNIRLRTAVFPA